MKDFTGNTPRLGLPLAMTCVAQFVVVLDVTIVTTALPVVRSSFESSANSLQWIITGYTLAFGGLLITGGRLADLIGPRRTFLLGLIIFTTASGACAALAWCQAARSGGVCTHAGLVRPMQSPTEPRPARFPLATTSHRRR